MPLLYLKPREHAKQTIRNRTSPTPFFRSMTTNFGSQRALYGTALMVECIVFGLIALSIRYYYRNLSHKTYRRWIRLGNTASGGVFSAIALLYALPSHQKRVFPAAHTTVLIAYTTFLVVDKALRPAIMCAVSKTAACHHQDLDEPEVWDLRSTQTSDAADPLATQHVNRSGIFTPVFVRGIAETIMVGCYAFVVAAQASATRQVRGFVLLLCLQWIIAIALGMRYAAMEFDDFAYCVLVLLHSIISPLGVVFGAVAIGHGGIHEMAFNMGGLFTAAILLYIGAFEMAYDQFVAHGRWLVAKSFAVCAGTWIVVGITGVLVSKGVY